MKSKLSKEDEEFVRRLMKEFGYSRKLAIDRMHHWS